MKSAVRGHDVFTLLRERKMDSRRNGRISVYQMMCFTQYILIPPKEKGRAVDVAMVECSHSTNNVPAPVKSNTHMPAAG